MSEYWKKVPTTERLVAFEDGSTFDLTDAPEEDFLLLEQAHGKVTGERSAECHKIIHYLLTGNEVLEGPNDWAGKYIPIVPVVGDEIFLAKTSVRKSLIRGARDGQQLYNYWRSAAAELIALAPKSKWLVTPKQIAEFKESWDRSNLSPKPYLLFKPDPDVGGGAPTRVAPPDPPSALWKEADLLVGDLKAATGIYEANLGAKGNETSGVAIATRQREGDTGAYHFRANLERSLEHAGRVMLDLIPKIYDSERVVRLTDQDGAHLFARINETVVTPGGQSHTFNDLSTGKFDIRVEIGPSSTTARAEAVATMGELFKADPSAAPLVRDLWVKNMDWPGADDLAARLKRAVPAQLLDIREKQSLQQEQAQQMQDPAAMQQMQAQAQQAQQAQATQQAAVQLVLAERKAKAAKLEAEAAGQQIDNELKMRELQLPPGATSGKPAGGGSGGGGAGGLIIAGDGLALDIKGDLAEIGATIGASSEQQGRALAESLGHGLDALGGKLAEGQQSMLQGMAEVVLHLTEQLEQQGQTVRVLAASVAEAAESAARAERSARAPKHVAVVRGEKGELVGADITVDNDSDE